MRQVWLVIMITFISVPFLFAQVISVDGVKDAFFDALTGPDDGYIQIQSFHHSEIGIPDNNADLSAKIWGAWDTDTLYLYAEVTDDNVSLAGATAIWEMDGVDMKIDGIPDDSTGSLSNACNFTAFDSSEVPEEYKVYCNNLDAFADTDKMYARGELTGGYILEWGIALDQLGGTETVNAVVGGVMGLGMTIQDNDGDRREAAEVWAAECDDNIWNTVKMHGTLKFLADNKVQFLATNNMTGRSNPYPYDGSTLGAISGTVTCADNGLPAENVVVRIYDSEWYQVVSALTNSAGNYVAAGLLAADYYVCAGEQSGQYLLEYYNEAEYQYEADPVSVTVPGTTTGIDFTLAQVGAVSGTVTCADNGLPIENMDVEVYDSGWNWVTSTQTDADGYYVITGFLSGNYYIKATGYISNQGDVFIVEYYNESPDQAGADLVSVIVPDTTTEIDLTLTQKGAISGLVTRQDNGLPIEDMTVIVFDSGWNYVTGINTDSDGNYVAVGLPTGNYYISAGENSEYLTEYYNESADQAGADLVSVTMPDTTTGVNFTLAQGGAISGTVTRQDNGLPIDIVEVNVYDSGWNLMAFGYPDSEGKYVVIGLPTGSYYVNAGETNEQYLTEYYDESPDQSGADLVSVALPDTTVGIDFTLGEAGSILGTVYGSDGTTPIDDAWVQLYDQSWNSIDIDFSDTQGDYSFSGLSTGDYYIRASGWIGSQGYVYFEEYYNESPDQAGADLISLTTPNDLTGIDFTLDQGATITGSVYESDGITPIENISVWVYDETWTWVRSDVTDAQGHFWVGLLTTGNYYVLATGNISGQGGVYFEEYYDESADRTGADLVGVTMPDTTKDIDFTLNRAGAISGTVYESDGTTPIEDTYIQVLDDSWSYCGGDFTDAQGDYFIGGLTSGSYYVLANGYMTDYSYAYIEEYYNESPDQAGADPVSVTVANTTTGIDFTLDDMPYLLLNCKVFLEGPYSASGDTMNTDLNAGGYVPQWSPHDDNRYVASIPGNIVDWIFVELRNTATGDAETSRSFFLRKDGMVTDDDGTTTELSLAGADDGSYFIVVCHRNHLAVMSATAQSLNSSSALSYDFTDNSDKYYGSINGVKELETGVWGMIAGDANGNGEVQVDDNSDYWWLQVGTAGYKSGDFNVNGEVQIDDQADYWWQNVGRGSQVP
ncbi:carboxypeptidase regulatory-like domain-containing protein [bacterium]